METQDGGSRTHRADVEQREEILANGIDSISSEQTPTAPSTEAADIVAAGDHAAHIAFLRKHGMTQLSNRRRQAADADN